jgi:ribosomal protein S27AE
MIQRQCPECDGELVLARHPDKQGPEVEACPPTYLRCSTCGGEFTAEQVLESKRAKQLDSATA